MMPYFAMICRDKPGALDTRMANREAHLAYVRDTGVVLFGGPMITDGQMRGSLLVMEAEDMEAAKAWSANDPYALAGLFDSVEITEWKRVVG
ncbi:YciI family protein [Paracoccus siganidrum]|uniref:YciI family protein n=1 Tax=Paracoccus siganidrum TaxID=1276757 RepID=A0A419A6L9_9RHOB|nr:YciI family protein [Paracoccus siganidrum]RJL13951.1 YciI family protein [Paracoccus siganidrum]RMC41004.1 YciI family protein [Paracoccus siganidrum]